MRQGEVLEEPGHKLGEDRPVVATGLIAKRRRQPTFADSNWTEQSQIVVDRDPFALNQLLEKGMVKTAGIAIIDILDAGLLAQFGDAQPRREAFVLPPGRFTIEQEAEPFVMAEAVGFTAGHYLSEGLGHSMQAEGMELVEGWMLEQVVSPNYIIVARPTDVGMQDRRSVRGALALGTPIEVVVEDGFYRTVGARADVDGALGGGFHTFGDGLLDLFRSAAPSTGSPGDTGDLLWRHLPARLHAKRRYDAVEERPSTPLVGLDGQQFTLTMPELDVLPRVKISANEHGAPHVFEGALLGDEENG
jgi:hypothetical protein